MKMVLLYICVLLPFIISTSSAFENVFCSALPTVVAVDPTHHDHFPYFVILHRCQGSVGTLQPTVQRCAAKSVNQVKINTFSPSSHSMHVVNLQNHTSCKGECVLNASTCHKEYEKWNPSSCRCHCKYQNGQRPATQCPKDFEWNPHDCRCKCTKVVQVCGIRKEWSRDLCKCTCSAAAIKRCRDQNKSIKKDSCTCAESEAVGNTPGVSGSGKTHLFITMLVLEAVVIAILTAILIHWIRKKKGYHDRTRDKYRGSTEPLTPRGSNRKDGNSYNTSKFFPSDAPSNGGDTKNATSKQSENSQN